LGRVEDHGHEYMPMPPNIPVMYYPPVRRGTELRLTSAPKV
jgi:hypothetical protein